MSNEIWKPIDGYENLYEVSNYGRVKSLGNGKSNNSKERFLKASKEGNGYLRVGLSKDGKKKDFKVHRLVASAFIENPNNLPQINHIDEDKQNNHVSNLEWCTAEYNNNYGTHNERVAKSLTGVFNTKVSKAVFQYTKQGEFIAEFPSVSEVQRQLGYPIQHISHCCLGKRKSANGYIWRYKETTNPLIFT